MRTLARVVTYTAIAATFALAMTLVWTAGLVAVVLAGCAVTFLGIVTVTWLFPPTPFENVAPGPDDDRVQQQVNRYHCAGHGCSWHLAEDDRVYICGVCGARVVRDADLYDRENGVA